MKLLLDENLPKRLKQDFPDHIVFTVREMKWNGISNGKLLELMLNEKFDALLTFDKNMEHQQNFVKYSIAVFVLTATINTYSEMKKLAPQINTILSTANLSQGIIVVS
jgi:predicted nuclease of predicted toxin-antitoxin system